eukprot:8002226-Alexandrium_andersonii.AAC.1
MAACLRGLRRLRLLLLHLPCRRLPLSCRRGAWRLLRRLCPLARASSSARRSVFLAGARLPVVVVPRPLLA